MTDIDVDPEMAPLATAGPDAPTIGTAGHQVMREVLSALSPHGGAEMEAIDNDEINGVRVRRYTPYSAAPGTIVFYHGGGWVVGTLDDYDHFARGLAARTRCMVISVGYRLAPEHPFPAAVDDAWSVLSGMIVAGPLFVCGDSAGGNLAAVMAQMARDHGFPRLVGQVLIYPSVSGDDDAPSMHAFVPPMMSREDISTYYSLYIPDRAARGDPRFAPARGRLDKLAPALIITAGADLLAAEGRAYSHALAAAGTEVIEHHQHGALHAYLTLLPNTGAAEATMEAIAAFVSQQLSRALTV